MNLKINFSNGSPCSRLDVLWDASGARETCGTNGNDDVTAGQLMCLLGVGVANLAERAVCTCHQQGSRSMNGGCVKHVVSNVR